MADPVSLADATAVPPATICDPSEQRRALWREATRLIIDSLYSARGNQVAAQRWQIVATVLGLPASGLLSCGHGRWKEKGKWPKKP